MATKSSSSKKSSSKKSAARKSAKKSSRKSTKKAGTLAVPPALNFPPPNLRCILACAQQYSRCLQKGVNPALCEKRFMRCIQTCISGGGVLDPGDDA